MADAHEAGKLLADVAQEIGRLSVDIADMTGDVEQVSGTLATQTISFGEIRDGASDIVDRNHHIAETATQTQHVAEQAERDAVSSERQVQTSLDVIGTLAASVGAIGGELAQLEATMSAVGRVAGNIDRIARQTNLLALNATIEAARAGDAGRGFAVVATEVKALARETSSATAEINATLAKLTQDVRRLVEIATEGAERATAVGESTATIGAAMRTMAEAVASVGQNAGRIATETDAISRQCEGFVTKVTEMTGGVERSTRSLKTATERGQRILGTSETIMSMTASAGVETIDTKFINAAVETARKIEERFSEAIAAGEITVDALFDKNLSPIKGSNPAQYMTRYIDFVDRVLPPLHDPIVRIDDRMVFCAVTDHNQLIPTHNPQFRQPQGPDPVWNAAHCRNRRKYEDKTAGAVARNTAPFLLQTYRRDMGGGVFALMKDVSAPIRVAGRLWGGLRVCYRA